MQNRSLYRGTAACVFAAALLSAGGCWHWPGHYPGGNYASMDKHVYWSTPAEPKTITLKNWATDEVIWSVDIPVGQQVVIRFAEGEKKDRDTATPDIMRWQLMPVGRTSGKLTNSMPVPDRHSRRLDMTLRTASGV